MQGSPKCKEPTKIKMDSSFRVQVHVHTTIRRCEIDVMLCFSRFRELIGESREGPTERPEEVVQAVTGREPTVPGTEFTATD